MIAFLKGELFFKSTDRLIVLVNGVGYEVFVTGTCLRSLPETGHTILIPVFTHVREDALLLYGFVDTEEKETFLLLTGVSGVGPKLALSILSGISVRELAASIKNEDIARLTRLSGVGKKTAERLCLELKEKVSHIAADYTAINSSIDVGASSGGLARDTVSALINLGYQQSLAEAAVKKALAVIKDSGPVTLENLFKQSLRQLS